MSTFTYPTTLIAASGDRAEMVEALVDTGVTFSSFQARLLERLEITPTGTIQVRLANGQEDDWHLGQVEADLDGTLRPILCLSGPPNAPPLLGAHAL